MIGLVAYEAAVEEAARATIRADREHRRAEALHDAALPFVDQTPITYGMADGKVALAVTRQQWYALQTALQLSQLTTERTTA